MKQTAQYSTNSTREVAAFLDAVSIAAVADGGADKHAVLDSVRNKPGVTIPKPLDGLLGKLTDADGARILDSIQMGISHYSVEHGSAPTADLVEAAIQQADVAFRGIAPDGSILDSATSLNHDPLSLQPNRAVVALLTAIAEAIPFAAYLPVDLQSNQSKLAILSHVAGSTYGDYTTGDLMDGISAGNVFASSARSVRFDVTGGTAPFNSKFTAINSTSDVGYCNAAATGVAVLRGRTIVFINGLVAAVEPVSGSAANSPLSGSVVIGGITYTVTGTVAPATGVISLTALTASSGPITGLTVTARAFVDYETSPGLIPNLTVKADVFDIYANPWRIKTGISIDSNSQLRNELGLDGNSEALMAIRTQMALERHFQALRMCQEISANNVVSYDFQYSTQILQKLRFQIWQDFQAVISNVDQKMANDTMDHGITHLYVPAFVAAQMLGLPSELFKPSGITTRPGIYRVGRLFDKYEVYFSPRVATQNAALTQATIIAIGRSTQVARCPIVLGDAVAPTFLQLSMGSDFVNNSGMYARDFTVVNPHQPSALGAARINITNLS